MSSRVNILVSFKIYSFTDTYYLVGSSNTGSFTHELGRGWNKDGSPQLYPVRISESDLPALESDGLMVSKVVSLGEKYGDYRMRLYAENELGIRSAYVELDKVIPAPDIDGTFRFNSIYIDGLLNKKPKAQVSVKKGPRKSSPTNQLANELLAESEFIGQDAIVKWDLRAPYGFTGAPKGTVVNASNIDLFNSLFSHFEIYFYKSNPEEKISEASDIGTAINFDSGNTVTDTGEIVDLSFDQRVGDAAIIDQDAFSTGISKGLIEDLIGEDRRRIYLKVVGKDIYYNTAGKDNYLHRFSAVIKLENYKAMLNEAYGDLYGNQMTISYAIRDMDFAGGRVVLRQVTSNNKNGPWENLPSKTLSSPGGSNTFKQKWSSPTEKNYYKYILEVHDSYGLCGYHTISNAGKIKGFFTKKLEDDDPSTYLTDEEAFQAAIDDSYSWEALRKIGAIKVKENGSSFDISWNVVDSQGHIISPPLPSKDSSGAPIFTIGDRIEVEDLAGFTVGFVCPDEYSGGTGVSTTPIRDAFNLSVLGIDSETDGNITYKYGSPELDSGQIKIPETIGIVEGIVVAEDKLSINLDTSITLSKEQNADLYRSWFNEINIDRAIEVNEDFRVLYKENNAASVEDYKNAGFYAVDAQRRISVRVSLIDSDGKVIDKKIGNGFNAPPKVLINQSSDIGKVSSASVKTTDLVEFKMSMSEKVNSIAVFRRPVEKYDEDEDIYYGLGGETNVDKTQVNESHAKPVSIYNFKDDDFFAQNFFTEKDIMLFGFGIDMDRWRKFDDPGEYISNYEYESLPDNPEEMEVQNKTRNKQDYVRFEVTGRNIVDPTEGGFFSSFISARGNSVNSDSFNTRNLLSGGRVIGAESNITILDQPPLIREDGIRRRKAPGTQYDYMLIPYDSFGSGEAWLPDRISIYGGVLFSEDENGAIGTLDFDAPFPPENLRITGANKTFFLEWQSPTINPGDIDYYNLYYIKDSRSESDRLGLFDGESIADGDIIRFARSFGDFEYDHDNSEFHSIDLDFKAGLQSSDVALWTAREYNINNYVKYRPRGNSSKSFRLYKAQENTLSTDIPGESNKWEEQLNVQLWENGSLIHKDEVKFNQREQPPELDGGGGSQTYNLFYWTDEKTYSVGQVVFDYDTRRCYKCILDTGRNIQVTNTLHWVEIEGVYIEEIKIPTSETSLTIQARSQDRAYFFFESVDRNGNRSKVHADPTAPEITSNEYVHTLGFTEVRDIENFEQELSGEFPNAIMLRPSDPFEIVDNSRLKWKSHYLYNDGNGYYIPQGEIELDDNLFTNQTGSPKTYTHNVTGSKIQEDEFLGLTSTEQDNYTLDEPYNLGQFIRYVYWNPGYGYNVNPEHISGGQAWQTPIDHELTLRENRLKYQKKIDAPVDAPEKISEEIHDRIEANPEWVAKPNSTVKERVVTSDPSDVENYYAFSADDYEAIPDYDSSSDMEGSSIDNKISKKSYYSFSTGNPASQIYNLKTDTNQWISDSSIFTDADQISTELNNTTNSAIHNTVEPAGFGAFGLHIPKSEKLKTNEKDGSPTLPIIMEGGFVICRIDYIDGTYSHKINFEVFNNATIGQANISNATITSAQITDLAADRITAGTIGSHKIEIGNSLAPEIGSDGQLIDSQQYTVRGDAIEVDANGEKIYEHIAGTDPDVNETTYNTFAPDKKLEYQLKTTKAAYTNSKYAYGSITSKDFGHLTKGKPGFFISGDGQFAFQTTNGGIYLRNALDPDRNPTNTPSQLVIRGTLIQENSDPFVKMEMRSSTQSIFFDEHAENNFYYQNPTSGDWEVYGTETTILRPSNGEVTISYNIQNAYHVDGSPYDINEMEMEMYVNGDPTKRIASEDVFKLIKPGSSNSQYVEKYILRTKWEDAGLDTNSFLPEEIETELIDSADIPAGDEELYRSLFILESSVHGRCEVTAGNYSDHKNKTACEAAGYRWIPEIRDVAANFGLNDTDDINKGGYITFDFEGSRYAEEYVDSIDQLKENEIIFFTGNPIHISDATETIEAQDLQTLSEDLSAAGVNEVYPIAQSVTVVLRIKSRTPPWDSTQTYLVGELTMHDGTLWRSIHNGSENTNQEPSSTSAYWAEESAGKVVVEEKSITISRIDQPTNITNIDLIADGKNVIRNNSGQVTVRPWLAHGTAKYNFSTTTGLLDWMRSMRSQLAIYQGPNNNTYHDKYKLWKEAADGTEFSVTLKNEHVKNGKTTLYLVDINDQTDFEDGLDNLDNYTEISTIDVLDVNDGQRVSAIEIDKLNKFFTRDYLIRPVNSSGAVEHNKSYKLEAITNKIFNAKIRLFPIRDEETSTQRELYKDIKIRIKDVPLGEYISIEHIDILDESDAVICSFSKNSSGKYEPTMVPFYLVGDNRVETLDYWYTLNADPEYIKSIESTGVGRVYFGVDNIDHVSEIIVKFDFIKTRGTNVAVVGSDDKISSTEYTPIPMGTVKPWGVWQPDSLSFNLNALGEVETSIAEENILINTNIESPPAYRMTLFKSFISYETNPPENSNTTSNKSLLRRSENTFPIQVWMGKDNITDEVDSLTELSTFSMDIVPTYGHVVSYKFLNSCTNGSNKTQTNVANFDGACWPGGQEIAARDAILDISSEGITEGVYYTGSKWKYQQSDGDEDLDSDYLIYIPPRRHTLPQGNSKISIKSTYARQNVPVPSVGVRSSEIGTNNKVAQDVFTDVEVLNVIEVHQGESAPFIEQDNKTVPILVQQDGLARADVPEEVFRSYVRVKTIEGVMALVPDSAVLVLGSSEYKINSADRNRIYFGATSAVNIPSGTKLKIRASGTVNHEMFDDLGDEIATDADYNSVKYIAMFDELADESESGGMPLSGKNLVFFDANWKAVGGVPMPKVFKHGIAILENDTLTSPAHSGSQSNFATGQEYYFAENNDSYLISYFTFISNSKEIREGDNILDNNGDPVFAKTGGSPVINCVGNIKVYLTSHQWKTSGDLGPATLILERVLQASMTGDVGAMIVYRSGNWSPVVNYIGSPERREVVRYKGVYYITNENASLLAWGEDKDKTLEPFNARDNNAGYTSDPVLANWKTGTGETDKTEAIETRLRPGSSLTSITPDVWETFGAVVESVATNLLLANDVRVQRGIVAGLENTSDAFFASQIDVSHLDDDGNYTYPINYRNIQYKVKINRPAQGNYQFADRYYIGPDSNVILESDYKQLSQESKHLYRQFDTEDSDTELLADNANTTLTPYVHQVLSRDGSSFSMQGPLHTTTWKLPFTDIPGFYIGYHDSYFQVTPDGSNDTTGMKRDINSKDDKASDAFTTKLPMMEFRSHTGNFFRWDGLRMEMYGSVVNGNVNPEGISVRMGAGESIQVFSGSTSEYVYSGQIFCGGGFNNYIPDSYQSLGSAIVGGGSNSIFGKFSFIGAGYGNNIHGSFNFIGSGYGNSIENSSLVKKVYTYPIGLSSTSSYDTCFEKIIGRAPTLAESVWGTGKSGEEAIVKVLESDTYLTTPGVMRVDIGYGGDGQESIAGKNVGNIFNAIVTGRGNLIKDSKYSIIGTGYNNVIRDACYSSILNGQGNNIGSFSNLYITRLSGEALSLHNAGHADHDFNGRKVNILQGSVEPSTQDKGSMWSNLGLFDNLSTYCDENGETDFYVLDGATIQNAGSHSESTKINDSEIDTDTVLVGKKSNGWYFLTTETKYKESSSVSAVSGTYVYIHSSLGPVVYSDYFSGESDYKNKFLILKTGPADMILYQTWKNIEDKAEGVGEGVQDPSYATINWAIFNTNLFNKKWSDSTPSTPSNTFIDNVANKLEYLNFVDLTYLIPEVSKDRFGYNTIAGGRGNFINRSSGTALIGSSGSYVSHLNSCFIAGPSNSAFGSSSATNGNQKGVTMVGSENFYNSMSSHDDWSNLMVSMVGSQNSISSVRRGVIVGSGNQVKYLSNSNNTIPSTTSWDSGKGVGGSEVNIFGTNNILKTSSNLYAQNLSIFGSNFILNSQEQVNNAYYIGNPFPTGGFLSRLFVAADGGAYFTGDVVSFALSDKKFKDNVSIIPNALEKILKIRGVSFDWNDQQKVYSGKDVGVIAQEIEEVLPEVVETRKTGKAVKYEKIVPLLIEGIKDQQSQIEDLKKMVEKLSSAINKLK